MQRFPTRPSISTLLDGDAAPPCDNAQSTGFCSGPGVALVCRFLGSVPWKRAFMGGVRRQADLDCGRYSFTAMIPVPLLIGKFSISLPMRASLTTRFFGRLEESITASLSPQSAGLALPSPAPVASLPPPVSSSAIAKRVCHQPSPSPLSATRKPCDAVRAASWT